eukprot:521177-Rhodomonas_salina.2
MSQRLALPQHPTGSQPLHSPGPQLVDGPGSSTSPASHPDSPLPESAPISFHNFQSKAASRVALKGHAPVCAAASGLVPLLRRSYFLV